MQEGQGLTGAKTGQPFHTFERGLWLAGAERSATLRRRRRGLGAAQQYLFLLFRLLRLSVAFADCLMRQTECRVREV